MYGRGVSVFDVAEPISRTAASAAAAKIREAIVEGRIPPGQRLKEETLAAELGISRTPIREALLVLQSEGLVEYTPNRGSSVRTYNADDLAEMHELRTLLEGRAARQAATRITKAEVDLLRASCRRFAKHLEDGNVRGLVEENNVLHDSIVRIAGSERLAGMLRSVVSLPLQYRSYALYSKEQAASSARWHEQLVDALAAGDAERAGEAMTRHLEEGRATLLAQSETPAARETVEL